MEKEMKICQSCGLPLDKDPLRGGTESDGSTSMKYCSFCYQGGKFLDEGITLKEKIVKNVQIAVAKLSMSEEKAREIAEKTLPKLERWR